MSWYQNNIFLSDADDNLDLLQKGPRVIMSAPRPLSCLQILCIIKKAPLLLTPHFLCMCIPVCNTPRIRTLPANGDPASCLSHVALCLKEETWGFRLWEVKGIAVWWDGNCGSGPQRCSLNLWMDRVGCWGRQYILNQMRLPPPLQPNLFHLTT